MREAAAELPPHIARGLMDGVKGTYYSSNLNLQPSRTSKWRQRKENEEIAARKENREAAFQEDNNKKSLVTHFFQPITQSSQDQGSLIEDEKKEERDEPVEAEESVSAGESVEAEESLKTMETAESEETREAIKVEELETPKEKDKLNEVEYIMQSYVAERGGQAPKIEEASRAIPVLFEVMKARRKAKVDYFTFTRLKQMLQLLRFYAFGPIHKGKWIQASEAVALSEGKAARYGKDMRRWCQAFILDHQTLPRNMHGVWKTSVLHSDEDLKLSIIAHLQGLGKYFSATDLLKYINTPEILDRLGRSKKLSLRTAQRWLKLVGFRWRKEAKGMYSDGHERQDVVDFRQKVFLPQYAEFHKRAAKFDSEGKEEPSTTPILEHEKPTMIHHHDETIFYGNDRRNEYWIHDTETPKLYAKGEGQSLMVADFVSSDIGWLSSSDGSQRARVVLRPGKARDGYFSCKEVMAQLSSAMDILDARYPSHQHVFILDNARTHTKRAETALSARRMPKNPHPTFGVHIAARGQDGKPILDESGQPQMEKRRIDNATFADGTSQLTYFPPDHPKFPNFFKGMTQLLLERGVKNPEKLRAECPKFKCPPETPNCCQRRILFNEPDFKNVPSLIEECCKIRGSEVLFLPKFQPELNFIEMCWGYAKRLYRETPPAPKIDQIEANALSCLDQVPLLCMRR